MRVPSDGDENRSKGAHGRVGGTPDEQLRFRAGLRRRRATQSRRRRRAKRIAFGVFILVVLLIGAGITAYYYLSKIPLPEAIPQPETSYMYAADGSVMLEKKPEEHRILVPYEAEGDGYDYADIPQHLIMAVVAREDRRFFEHSGVDVNGIARAAWNDIRNKPIQGGSTIPQQYVKNTLLTDERSLMRKIKEATLSIKLSREFSKDETMSLYLNTIYFGRGAYGVEAAAQEYFQKSARDLTLNESAYLGGIISSPEISDPADGPEAEARAIKRRDLAIDAMTEVGYLTQDQAVEEKFVVDEAGEAQPRPVIAPQRDPQTIEDIGDEGYFADYVWHTALPAIVGDQRRDRGGLRVHTTLDRDVQGRAQEAAEDVLDRDDDPDFAVVTLDRDGRVVAMVGGRDYSTSQVNIAVGTEGGGLGRQPGSTFKPVVLAAALQQGTSPWKTYSAPSEITLDDPNGEVWNVGNAGDGAGGGSMTLVQATQGSVNTVYAQLIQDVGVPETIDMAAKLGIRADLTPAREGLLPEPAIALGSKEVSPLDMASAFNTFANNGERVDTSVIDRIETSTGELVWENPRARERVLEEGAAANLTAMLQRVVASGTGKGARIPGVPVAGKTGTTQGAGDAWFVGYTPKYTTAVWIGYSEGIDRSLDGLHGYRRVYGGTFPADIWKRLMSDLMDDLEEPGEFPDAPDVSKISTNKPESSDGGSSSKRGSSSGGSSPTTSPPTEDSGVLPDPEPPPAEAAEPAPADPPDPPPAIDNGGGDETSEGG